MSPPVKISTFAGGEITPAAWARSDLSLYEKSAKTLRNMICMKHGGATGRPGTQFLGTAFYNASSIVRLIPFIFNETGVGQSYILEFGYRYVAFWQNGARILPNAWAIGTAYTVGMSVTYNGLSYYSIQDGTGHQPDISHTFWTQQSNISYMLGTPYNLADLAGIQFAQCGDILTLVHPLYAPMELARLSATSWALTTITFGPSISAPVLNVPTGTAGAVPVVYEVGAVNAQGEESEFGVSSTTLAAPTAAAPITVTWGAVTGAINYRVYKGSPGGGTGYIGTIVGTTFVDGGLTPDYTNAPVVAFGSPFTGAGNYPSTVGFVQQRRCFGATLNNPLGFWMSTPGDFYNFDVHTFAQDSDAVYAGLAGEEVNAIQHLLELKFMLILTAGAEIYVQGNGSGVVTPSAINASTQSQYGSAPLRALKTGDVLIFLQALGSKVRDFAFDFAIDGYRGNDISIYASHLFEGHQIVDWCYQREPDSIIWAVREDGILLSCTYIREQQVLAWTHHDFINGFVENVCAIPENGEYAVYLTIRRVINGATVRYIERLSSRIWTDPAGTTSVPEQVPVYYVGDPINATYLDCFSSYNGNNLSSARMTLTATGAFLTTPQAYQQQLTLTSTNTYFGVGATAQVGDQIFLMDALWISRGGTAGNQLKLTIQSITNGRVAVVTPEGIVPVVFQGVQTYLWARAVNTVSGLGYLAGQQVSIWADRYVVGSPLNNHIDTVYTVPASGVLTLDKCYSVIYVGLPITQDIETLDLETFWGETILGRRKRLAGLTGYIYQTRSFYAGSENPDTNLQNAAADPLFQLFPLKLGVSTVTYDQPPPLVTQQDYVITKGRWNKSGGIFIRNCDPVPFTILALSPIEEDAVTTPYKRV